MRAYVCVHVYDYITCSACAVKEMSHLSCRKLGYKTMVIPMSKNGLLINYTMMGINIMPLYQYLKISD